MKRGLVLLLFVLFSFGVYACPQGQSVVLKLSSATNAHGAVFSSSLFTQEVCAVGAGNNCASDNSNLVLKLSGNENAHAEVKDLNNYNTKVCFGDLDCSYVESGNCPVGKTCLVTLSSKTNAHLALCENSVYPVKICCTSRAVVTGEDGGEEPACSSDSDCPVENICVGGDCVTGCRDYTKCPNDRPACVDGACVARECAAGCPPNTPLCLNNLCVQCIVSDDCSSGEICKTDTNQCIAPPTPECEDDEDCEEGEKCEGDSCIQTSICDDGKDNDNDGEIDLDDPDCASSDDENEAQDGFQSTPPSGTVGGSIGNCYLMYDGQICVKGYQCTGEIKKLGMYDCCVPGLGQTGNLCIKTVVNPRGGFEEYTHSDCMFEGGGYFITIRDSSGNVVNREECTPYSLPREEEIIPEEKDLWWLWVLIGVVVVGGAGGALFYLKKKGLIFGGKKLESFSRGFAEKKSINLNKGLEKKY